MQLGCCFFSGGLRGAAIVGVDLGGGFLAGLDRLDGLVGLDQQLFGPLLRLVRFSLRGCRIGQRLVGGGFLIGRFFGG